MVSASVEIIADPDNPHRKYYAWTSVDGLRLGSRTAAEQVLVLRNVDAQALSCRTGTP
jgi:hypothetical protein